MQSKAAQILRALNSQIQHSPQAKSEPPQSLTSTQQRPPQTNQQSQLVSQIIESKMPKTIFNTKMKYEQNREAPEWLSEILQKQMGSVVHESIFENVESMVKEREKNAYDSYTKGDNEYISILLEQVRRKDISHMDFVSSLMSARLNKVEKDLNHGALVVNHDRNISNRKQFEKLQRLDLARMIKIKDGELRSKMDILHDKMQEFDNISQWHLQQPQDLDEEITKKVMQNIDAKSFDLASERTRIASEYARYMQQQRVSYEKRRKQRQARWEKEEKERQADLKEAQEMRDISRHEQILRRIEAKRKKREEEEKEQQGKEEQARRLLAEYHRKLPIFKIKEKQFQQQVVKPQEQFREEKLKEISEYKKSMSLQELKQHQSKYLGKLQAEKAKREQQFKLIMKSRRLQLKGKYYRGSAHARMEQMTKEEVLRNYSLREASKLKAHRMKEYGQVVHKQHQPTVDEDKKNELIKLVEKEMMRKKRARKIFKQVIDESTQQIKFQHYYEELPQKDTRQEGNKFFQEAKKHIKRKDQLSPLEKIEQLQDNPNRDNAKLLQNSKTESEKVKRNVWEIRAKQLKEIASSEVSDAKNFEYVKLNIQNLDSKAALREQLMGKIKLRGEQEMREKAMLQDFYMQSIRQKMRLLN